jgi:hypothetical protein
MKGSIYAIRSHQTPNIYIGSTIQILCKRFGGHKRDYKNQQKYCSSFEIIQYEDAYIELIEIVEYNEKSELFAREGYYIRTMECVNKLIMGRTHKEYAKEWYDENKKRILEERKKYAIDNKDKIKEYQTKYKNDNREKIKKQQNEKYRQKKDKLFLDEIIIE